METRGITRDQAAAEAASAERWYEIREAAGASGDERVTEIFIYGPIGGWFGIWVEDFLDELQQVATPVVKLRIHSPGGSVFHSIGIASAMAQHPAHFVAYVDSLAASGASIIATAADEVVMMPGAQMMVHDASLATYGNSEQLRLDADFVDRQSANVADFYARHAGGTAEEWRALMKAETWVWGDEAVKLGLADRVEEGAGRRDKVLERSHDLGALGYRYAGRAAAPAPRIGVARTRPTRQQRSSARQRTRPAGSTLLDAASARADAHRGGGLPAMPAGAARCLSTQLLGRPTSGASVAAVAELPRRIRASQQERDGKTFWVVEGYFSVYERGYEMWDEFGPYVEIVSAGAGRESLAANPDVNFLINHAGLSLARTINGTLELWEDEVGGANRAWLNPQRTDVKDLVQAIDDKTVTEQSFAFIIVKGRWSPDFTEFRIESYDIDRGDTSAVNYGANPYTSIATRSLELLRQVDRIPRGIAAELTRRLTAGAGAGGDGDTVDVADWLERQSAEAAQDQSRAAGMGPSAADLARMAEIEAFLARAEADTAA